MLRTQEATEPCSALTRLPQECRDWHRGYGGLAAISLANWRAERSLVRIARELQLSQSRKGVNSFYLEQRFSSGKKSKVETLPQGRAVSLISLLALEGQSMITKRLHAHVSLCMVWFAPDRLAG